MGIEIECAAVVVEEGEEGDEMEKMIDRYSRRRRRSDRIRSRRNRKRSRRSIRRSDRIKSEIVEEIIEEEAEDAGALVESWSRVVAGGDSKYSQCMSEIVDGCESVKAVCVIMRW